MLTCLRTLYASHKPPSKTLYTADSPVKHVTRRTKHLNRPEPHTKHLDMVERRSADDLAHEHDPGVPEPQQDADLPQRGDGEAFARVAELI